MKILLIDDDAFLRDMYATKFTEKGHKIECVSTSEEAIARLHDKNFDVVLSDVIMPGMTGVELLSHIEKEHLGGSPKCIILSNQSDDTDKKAAYEAGAIGYIIKAELIPSEVVAEVEKIVSK